MIQDKLNVMEHAAPPEQRGALADQVYVELVRTLYANMAPSMIMSAAFTLAVILVFRELGHLGLLVLGVSAVLATLARVTVTGVLRRKALTAPLNRPAARSLELAFGIPYVTFAAFLGLFAAGVFWLHAAEAHMIMICLLVGYCAGVATGTGLRPLIAVPSMFLAIVPAVSVAALRMEPLYLGTSAISLALLAGGTHSLLVRVNSVTAEVTTRLNARALARHDALTTLPNRLALWEFYQDNHGARSRTALTAVHYLDLDGFKPVNDLYGHAAGDHLLRAVADRLTNCVRNEDIVARMGGDEFAIVQLGLQDFAEADNLAQRVDEALRRPFWIGQHVVHISASIGSITTSDPDSGLEDLLRRADQELYSVKRARACSSAQAA